MSGPGLQWPVSGFHTCVEVREAALADKRAVVELMDETLDDFYSGDHRAHANRIFKAHIEGGQDHLGHFSFEQRMLVATVDGEFAAILHLVGKRQGTYKISPLIVEARYRHGFGIGTLLLRAAEEYVKAREARQLYCTVAEANIDVLRFFERNGFLVAGMSDSHYKAGMREYMLYKILEDAPASSEGQPRRVSVVPFLDKYADETRSIILSSTLARDFSGVDDEWVDALFAGYRRRQSLDVNAKYKLIYVAVDLAGKVLGVGAATPKKGKPIKLMPLVAVNQEAFVALLSELPWALRRYGHKLYAHLTPSVAQTVALQRLGWVLDAALPGAYHNDRVTQQWSKGLGGDDMRTLFIKRQFFNLIKQGRKSLEVRVGYSSMNSVRSGEEIHLKSGDEVLPVHVESIRRYNRFDEMLRNEDAERIVPGQSGNALGILRAIYNKEKEDLGVIVMEIKPIDQGSAPQRRRDNHGQRSAASEVSRA